jgi:hypothetical protein
MEILLSDGERSFYDEGGENEQTHSERGTRGASETASGR